MWGWKQSRTQAQAEGLVTRGFRSSHLLTASVTHFNKLSLCKLYKEITACALSFSKPLAHLSQPLHILSHLLLLTISLCSLLCAGGCWHADLTPLSWAFRHQSAHRRGRDDGVLSAWRSAKEIWPQSNSLSHLLCALTHSNNDSKQLKPAGHLSSTLPPDKEWNLVAHYCCLVKLHKSNYGDFHA